MGAASGGWTYQKDGAFDTPKLSNKGAPKQRNVRNRDECPEKLLKMQMDYWLVR